MNIPLRYSPLVNYQLTAYVAAPDEAEPVTLSDPLLTWTDTDNRVATLQLTLSAELPTSGSWSPAGFTLHAAGCIWDFSAATASASGTTLTIVGVIGTVVDDNYDSGDDLLGYSGSDSERLPNVAAVDLVVTFPGGALCTVVSAGYDDPGDFAAATMSRDIADFTTTPGHFAAWFNNHRLTLGGTASRSAASEIGFNTVSEGAVDENANELIYSGRDTQIVDTAVPPRPVPPFRATLEAV